MFLLVEDNQWGLTAMMIIIIIVIVINVCHGLGVILCAVFFWIKRESFEKNIISIIAMVIGGVFVVFGSMVAVFFKLSPIAAIVGFSISLLVQVHPPILSIYSLFAHHTTATLNIITKRT